MFFSVNRPSVFANLHQIRLGSYSLGKTLERGLLCLSMFILQRDCSQVLKKSIYLILNLASGWGKIYIHFKGKEKEFTIASFLK
jgi:hypothetical protein